MEDVHVRRLREPDAGDGTGPGWRGECDFELRLHGGRATPALRPARTRVHSGSEGAIVHYNNTSAYQEFHSAPGEVWGASAWAQRNNYDDDDYDYGDGNLYLNITYLNGDGGEIATDWGGAQFLWTDWEHYSRTFPAAPAGTAKVRIGFYFDNSGKSYLDDCAIVAPVPGVTARGGCAT